MRNETVPCDVRSVRTELRQNTKAEEVIMCCLVRSIAYIVRWGTTVEFM
jgi:hypothetical protein